MRIAIIGYNVNHRAGAANVTANLVERLGEDHQVSVFSHATEGMDLSKIKYHKVPAVTHPKFLAFITFLVSSTLILLVLSFLKKRAFDVIHSMGYECPFGADVITSHFCERECLHLEKSNIIEIPHKSVLQKLKALDYRIYRRVAAFIEGLIFGRNSAKVRIAVSHRLKEQLVSHYGSAAQSTIVIPNAVDCEIFTPTNRPIYREQNRQKHGVLCDDLVLIFVGGDWERKGVRYLIEALSLLARTDVKLFIIGSGDEKFYGQFAEQKGVRGRITFVTACDNIGEYYAASDIFVFPTIYEPFGLTIVEAMASGLPVITARAAGAADLITDGVNGLLLDEPSDISDLTTKIESLLSNTELRRTMGERARETAEGLSWGRVVEETQKLYNSVLK